MLSFKEHITEARHEFEAYKDWGIIDNEGNYYSGTETPEKDFPEIADHNNLRAIHGVKGNYIEYYYSPYTTSGEWVPAGDEVGIRIVLDHLFKMSDEKLIPKSLFDSFKKNVNTLLPAPRIYVEFIYGGQFIFGFQESKTYDEVIRKMAKRVKDE